MSDKTYGEIIFKILEDNNVIDNRSVQAFDWENAGEWMHRVLETVAQAVIDEYKHRHEDDTKPLPIEVNVTTRGYEWDAIRNNWFPRVHADGDNYVEDSIS